MVDASRPTSPTSGSLLHDDLQPSSRASAPATTLTAKRVPIRRQLHTGRGGLWGWGGYVACGRVLGVEQFGRACVSLKANKSCTHRSQGRHGGKGWDFGGGETWRGEGAHGWVYSGRACVGNAKNEASTHTAEAATIAQDNAGQATAPRITRQHRTQPPQAPSRRRSCSRTSPNPAPPVQPLMHPTDSPTQVCPTAPKAATRACAPAQHDHRPRVLGDHCVGLATARLLANDVHVHGLYLGPVRGQDAD